MGVLQVHLRSPSLPFVFFPSSRFVAVRHDGPCIRANPGSRESNQTPRARVPFRMMGRGASVSRASSPPPALRAAVSRGPAQRVKSDIASNKARAAAAAAADAAGEEAPTGKGGERPADGASP